MIVPKVKVGLCISTALIAVKSIGGGLSVFALKFKGPLCKLCVGTEDREAVIVRIVVIARVERGAEVNAQSRAEAESSDECFVVVVIRFLAAPSASNAEFAAGVDFFVESVD